MQFLNLGKIESMNELFEKKILFATQEIEIHAESLKIQIDEMKDALMQKFNKIKIDFEK